MTSVSLATQLSDEVTVTMRFCRRMVGRSAIQLCKALLLLFVGMAVSQQVLARYAAMVVDEQTGEVLFARNADERRYPASLTKIMTLYMVFDALERSKLRIDQQLPVSKRAQGQAPSSLRLRAGGHISVEDAILALVTRSANDVATVLAEGLAKSEFEFALEMTEKAQSLGMKRTTFRNASGLPDRRQRTTARDMVVLARAIRRDFPQYYHYFAVKEFSYGGKRHANHNSLLTTYDGTDGIKTGYIRASGFNLVASVRRGDIRLIGVVFGGRSARTRDAHMREIMTSAFGRASNRVARSTVKASVQPTTLSLSPTNAGMSSAPGTGADNAGEWKVQVGAYYQFSAAEHRAREAMKHAAMVLKAAVISVAPVSNNGRTLYRARLMQLSKREARDACRVLQKQQFDCFPLAPSTI